MEKPRLSPHWRYTFERCLIVLWLVAVAWLLFATLRAQALHAAELPRELGASTLFFRGADGFDPAAPLSTDVRISVVGVVARIRVAQRFRNDGPGWVEAVYAMPLPDDAAVDRLTIRIGERVIEGEIREREAAERIYAQARDAGKRASLVSQTTPNIFKTSVANIGPGEAIDVTIEYLQTARYDAGEFSLRFPMTSTPRYGADAPLLQGGADAASPHYAAANPRVIKAALVNATPPTLPVTHEANIDVLLEPGVPLAAVGARSHAVRIVRDGASDRLELSAPSIAMDRDFVLYWRPALGRVPRVTALTETEGDETYALLMILPPGDTQSYQAEPREVLYVIDTSGSMAGTSLREAQTALETALGHLTGADRFNAFQFNSSTSSLYRAPVSLTSESYTRALAYVKGLKADGGTEMAPAIRAALAQPATPGYLRQVIFLTDGGVANETALFAAIKQGLGDARLFTIGIGSAPNSYFMRKAAQFGRGTYTHIGNETEVADAMQALFDKLERVALTDVLVDWPAAAEIYPPQAPDLYAGEPLVMTASWPAHAGDDAIAVQAFGRIAGTLWSHSVTAHADSLPGIAELWARRKIEYLIDSRVDGIDEALIRKSVVDVALAHHLVSPYTSLVAVDHTPARASGTIEHRALANMTPAGNVVAGLPQTATAAPLYRWLGLVLLAIAAFSSVGAYVTRRPLAST